MTIYLVTQQTDPDDCLVRPMEGLYAVSDLADGPLQVIPTDTNETRALATPNIHFFLTHSLMLQSVVTIFRRLIVYMAEQW